MNISMYPKEHAVISKKKTTAFSLVEVMVSLAIFSALSMGLFGILNTGVAIYVRDTALLDLQQEARNAMARLTRELRESKTSAITVISTDKDRITFSTPNEGGIDYYLNGTALIREYPAGTQKIVAGRIACLKFTKTDVFLAINIEARQTLYGNNYVFLLKENVRLRNE